MASKPFSGPQPSLCEPLSWYITDSGRVVKLEVQRLNSCLVWHWTMKQNEQSQMHTEKSNPPNTSAAKPMIFNITVYWPSTEYCPCMNSTIQFDTVSPDLACTPTINCTCGQLSHWARWLHTSSETNWFSLLHFYQHVQTLSSTSDNGTFHRQRVEGLPFVTKTQSQNTQKHGVMLHYVYVGGI